MTAVKISILYLYSMVFTTPLFRRASIVVGLICIAWFLAGVFSTIFQCTPIAAAWNPSIPSHCIHGVVFFQAIVSLNLLTDLVILCLPLRMVWDLHLDIRQKFILLGLFSLGGL